jgi:hypothetical protein
MMSSSSRRAQRWRAADYDFTIVEKMVKAHQGK